MNSTLGSVVPLTMFLVTIKIKLVNAKVFLSIFMTIKMKVDNIISLVLNAPGSSSYGRPSWPPCSGPITQGSLFTEVC